MYVVKLLTRMTEEQAMMTTLWFQWFSARFSTRMGCILINIFLQIFIL